MSDLVFQLNDEDLHITIFGSRANDLFPIRGPLRFGKFCSLGIEVSQTGQLCAINIDGVDLPVVFPLTL